MAKSELHTTSFRDPSISSGLWLINLCEGIQPHCVNWEIVTAGESDEDKALNAKYAISIARMLGAVVFCVWEDIVAAKEKMILVFVCALNEVSKNKSHGLKSPLEEAKVYQGEAVEENKADIIESTPNEEFGDLASEESKESSAVPTQPHVEHKEEAPASKKSVPEPKKSKD